MLRASNPCSLCLKAAITGFPEPLCLDHQVAYWQGLLQANKHRPPPPLNEDEVVLKSFAHIKRFSPR